MISFSTLIFQLSNLRFGFIMREEVTTLGPLRSHFRLVLNIGSWMRRLCSAQLPHSAKVQHVAHYSSCISHSSLYQKPFASIRYRS